MKIEKINIYLLIQISKFFFLIFFIFLSIAWLLQITRLFTISNFIHIGIIDIVILSLYLIPNLTTIIVPFILIFGLLLCFIRLNKSNEIISILSLGLGLVPFKKSLFIFCTGLIFIFSALNFYIAPKIYKKYKFLEYELRNTIDLNNMAFSNFLNLNKTTILDFKKKNSSYEDIFLSFKDDKENIIYAKNGNIFSEGNKYNFQLTDGFKISVDKNNQIEKLEFLSYVLKVDNNNIKDSRDIVDKNTLTIFDDLNLKNYSNITYKIVDIILMIFITILFYKNNLKKINFDLSSNIYFSTSCIIVLIINQICKNSEINFLNYVSLILSIIIISTIMTYVKAKYEQN